MSFPNGNPFPGGGGTPPIDPEALNAVLEKYGVHMPNRLQPPGPFEAMGQNNPGGAMGGFFNRHPGIATAGDNALIALGNMGPTQMSAGDNISNVARSVLGVQPYRRQQAAQQFEAPLAAAKEIGGLQTQQAMVQRDKAMFDMYSSRSDLYDAQAKYNDLRNQTALEVAGLRGQLAAKPILGVDRDPASKTYGQPMAYERKVDENGNVVDTPNPNLDVRPLLHEQHVQRFGGGQQGEFIATHLAQEYGGVQNIPVEPDKTYTDRYDKWLQKYTDMTKIVPYMADRNYANSLPPSQAKTVEDTENAWKGEYQGLKFGKMPADLRKNATRDTVHKLMDGGMDYISAKAKADSDTQASDQQLDQTFSKFTQLPLSERMKFGSFKAYAEAQGFDSTSHTFTAPQATPQTPVSATGRPSSPLASVAPTKPKASATGASQPSGPPKGAIGTATGPDGKVHWVGGNHEDLGIKQ